MLGIFTLVPRNALSAAQSVKSVHSLCKYFLKKLLADVFKFAERELKTILATCGIFIAILSTNISITEMYCTTY